YAGHARTAGLRRPASRPARATAGQPPPPDPPDPPDPLDPRDLLAFARARLVRRELRRASATHPPSLARVLSGASYGGQARPTRLRSRAACLARATAGEPALPDPPDPLDPPDPRDLPAFARARLVRRELRRASATHPTHLTHL